MFELWNFNDGLIRSPIMQTMNLFNVFKRKKIHASKFSIWIVDPNFCRIGLRRNKMSEKVFQKGTRM